MRGAVGGWIGCGLVLADVGLGAPFVCLGEVTLAGRSAPYAGVQGRAIGQPEPPPPPPGRWPHIKALPLAVLGLLLAAGGCVAGIAALPARPVLGKVAAAGGLAAGLVIAGALGVDFASGFAWGGPAQ